MISTRLSLFQAFKYAVYLLLALNIYWFFAEEWAAAAHRFVDGVGGADIIEGFAATIDTAAWVVLLLMFELETCVLSEHHFTPRVRWTLHGLRLACYACIVYAFYGYVVKLWFLQAAGPLPGVDNLCALVGQHWSYATDLDEYLPLDAANCSDIGSAPFVQFAGAHAVVDTHGYRDILRLAWVDVINAGVWLGVVAMLEIDVYLQARDKLHGRILLGSTLSKYCLYATLLLAAVYWGVKGDFVDFWDAFLWLLAFAFIEMNFFEWQQEMRDNAAPPTTG